MKYLTDNSDLPLKVYNNQNELVIESEAGSEKYVEHLYKKYFMEENKPTSATIEYADYLKIEMKAGTIKEAERVPKSDKLLKLKVDFGTEERQIVTNIGTDHQPESLVGIKTIFVTNLKPAKIMGIESNGMIFCAKNIESKASIIKLNDDVENGSKVG